MTGAGPYPPHEVADALDTPLLAALPTDPAAAQQLAAGGGRTLQRSRLWRALVQTADDLARQQTARIISVSDGEAESAAAVEDSVVAAGVA